MKVAYLSDPLFVQFCNLMVEIAEGQTECQRQEQPASDTHERVLCFGGVMKQVSKDKRQTLDDTLSQTDCTPRFTPMPRDTAAVAMIATDLHGAR